MLFTEGSLTDAGCLLFYGVLGFSGIVGLWFILQNKKSTHR